MLVKEIMTPNVECISPTASLKEAAQRMKSLNVGAIPVCGDNDKLVGMVTDRDITIRCVAEGGDVNSASVEDIMTPDIMFCRDSHDISEATELMRRHQVRRLVVIDDDKRLAGIISLGDVAAKTNADSLSQETLEAVSTPTK